MSGSTDSESLRLAGQTDPLANAATAPGDAVKAQGLHIAVIGAGFIGTCIAYDLLKRGHRVVLVDRDEPGLGASFGNSGAISPGSVAPVGMPGIVSKVPGMLLDREGALRLPLGYLPRALPWLLKFIDASRPHRVREIAAKLAKIHEGAIEAHRALTREVGVPELFLQQGHLHLYTSASARAADSAGWALREQHGYRSQAVERDGILALEPRIGSRYQSGVFVEDHATIRNPHRYLRAIVAAFVGRGGEVLRLGVRRLVPEPEGWRLEGDTPGSTPLRAQKVVVAAGAWSRALLDPLGVKLPIESQRGYHAQFKGASALVSRTVVLVERKVFVTPMEPGLRVGGMVEIGGLSRPPDPTRYAVLRRVALEAFDRPEDRRLLEDAQQTEWMGHRPCLPDSVPVVAPADGAPNLWVALGHGHLGVTNSALAGRWLDL